VTCGYRFLLARRKGEERRGEGNTAICGRQFKVNPTLVLLIHTFEAVSLETGWMSFIEIA